LKSLTKSERLHQIELLLFNNTRGMKRAELAKKLGVARSTISRDVDTLSNGYAVFEDENNNLFLDSLSCLNSIPLTLSEIQILSIASRLLSRKLRFPYLPAGSALRKLGESIEKYSPQYGKVIKKTADVFDFDYGNNENKEYGKRFDTLIEAAAAQKPIRLHHYSTRLKQETAYIFHIYHIEPHAEGNSLQIVGYAPEVAQIRTFKFERLTKIEILEQHYEIPQDFNADEYFKDCWSIWTSETEPEQVELLFTKNVKHRVKQTRWHISQIYKENKNGTLTWKAEIASPKEMLPWIRGWGKDVEVIKPHWLREQVAEELKEAAKIYEKD